MTGYWSYPVSSRQGNFIADTLTYLAALVLIQKMVSTLTLSSIRFLLEPYPTLPFQRKREHMATVRWYLCTIDPGFRQVLTSAASLSSIPHNLGTSTI